ncbi:type VI secretion system membrane subunit TssM [Polaromonas naphthalenivorans]|nr:hypothetical protein [Polaromonas naphthalenivorans]
MNYRVRFFAAVKAAFIHLLCSLALALLAGILVFSLWYPYPYRELSGGRELFLLVMAVDVVCGPLLMLVLFNPAKPLTELWRDLGLVVLIQLGALGYGLWTVWQARPLFLVVELERLKVVSAPDLRLATDPLAAAALANLPASLKPRWFEGPTIVALRESKNEEEATKVMIDYTLGGRDFSDRPEFYIKYDDAISLKSLQKAKPLMIFLQKQPGQQSAAEKLAAEKGADIAEWVYLPIAARQDWVAVLNKKGKIEGFLRGKGI